MTPKLKTLKETIDGLNIHDSDIKLSTNLSLLFT